MTMFWIILIYPSSKSRTVSKGQLWAAFYLDQDTRDVFGSVTFALTSSLLAVSLAQ